MDHSWGELTPGHQEFAQISFALHFGRFSSLDQKHINKTWLKIQDKKKLAREKNEFRSKVCNQITGSCLRKSGCLRISSLLKNSLFFSLSFRSFRFKILNLSSWENFSDSFKFLRLAMTGTRDTNCGGLWPIGEHARVAQNVAPLSQIERSPYPTQRSEVVSRLRHCLNNKILTFFFEKFKLQY